MALLQPGLPWLRKLKDFLVARGTYRPQVTQTNARGETVVVQEEIVEGKGVLRDSTIWAALMTAATSGTAMVAMLKEGVPDGVIFEATAAAFIGALGVIWRHVRSWMPVKGAAPPTPTR